MSSPSRRVMLAVGLAIALVLAAYPGAAFAYIGPGAGISLFGAAMGVISALFAALGIVLLWPVRMLIRMFRRTATKSEPSELIAQPNAGEGSESA